MTQQNQNPLLRVVSIFLSVLEWFTTLFYKFDYKVPQQSANHKWVEEELEKNRYEADDIAQQCYDILKAEYNHFPANFDMIEEIKRRANEEHSRNNNNHHDDQPQPFHAFYDQVFTIPPWVDFKQIERGQYAVRKAAFPTGVLALTSGCLVESYTGAKGAEVLAQTGRLKDDVVKRILETGHFIHSILLPDSLHPGNSGHKTALQVRLLHCAIRNFLNSRPKKWEAEELGQPINQEDLTGTLCVFVVIFAECHLKLGYLYSQQEKEDILALWRYVGYIMGVKEELLPKTYVEMIDLAYAINKHQCKPNDISTALVRLLFEGINFSPYYFFLPGVFWSELSRYLVGDELANKIGIPPSNSFWFSIVRVVIIASRIKFLLHQLPLILKLETFIIRRFFTVFLYLGLKGRSVDFKMKQY